MTANKTRASDLRLVLETADATRAMLRGLHHTSQKEGDSVITENSAKWLETMSTLIDEVDRSLALVEAR
ncbi:hypothetical protein [uncultured Novosphingobium sp.]|uniref:hypothetical protein n=1 Tax=uncultured Novosphingobium sp. TaxID=292277 RepID=UPI00259AA596|nr:hypothetical protein [uncultured Novosphingobium sp.]